MSKPLLTIDRLSARFKQSPVFSNVSFAVPEHQITALCGKNGSGKSTLIGILAGLLPSSGGRVWYLDHPWDKEAIRKTGFVFDHVTFPPYFNAKQILTLLCGVKDAHEWISLLGLPDRKPFFQYSKGMRQKIGVAFALIKRPEFLVMDEAVSSIDPQTRHVLFNYLGRETQEGRITVFMTAHHPQEEKNWADHVFDLSCLSKPEP